MGEGATAPVDEDRLSALLDDRDFQAVHARMGRFNIFEAVGGVRGELRHSNFLANLLSPGRSHGLGSAPLTALLRAILEQLPPAARPVMTLEILVGDLDGAIVHRERDNIDLLIEVAALNLVVVIENKVDARAGEGQLERYRTRVEARYPQARKLYVFLTPDGHDPDHPAYVAFSYARLAQVLEALVQDEAGEVGLIVRHYVQMLRRYIVPDQELRELAAKLYARHAEAFDFILECRPEQGGLLQVAAGQLEATPELLVDSRSPSLIRFAPQAWDPLSSIACDPALWSRTGRPLLFEIKTPSGAPGRVSLALLMGPADPAARLAFYEAARAQPQLFRGITKPYTGKWTTLFSQDLLSSAQAQTLGPEEQGQAVLRAWGEFAATTLPMLTQAILEIDATAAG